MLLLHLVMRAPCAGFEKIRAGVAVEGFEEDCVFILIMLER